MERSEHKLDGRVKSRTLNTYFNLQSAGYFRALVYVRLRSINYALK